MRLLLLEISLNLLLYDTNELDAITHLFSQRNRVRADVLVLSQPEGCNAAGVLEPPLFSGCLSPGQVM